VVPTSPARSTPNSKERTVGLDAEVRLQEVHSAGGSKASSGLDRLGWFVELHTKRAPEV